jgi:hypothetical protein
MTHDRRITLAREALTRRESMPLIPGAWGATFGLTPVEALGLVRDEERRRVRA